MYLYSKVLPQHVIHTQGKKEGKNLWPLMSKTKGHFCTHSLWLFVCPAVHIHTSYFYPNRHLSYFTLLCFSSFPLYSPFCGPHFRAALSIGTHLNTLLWLSLYCARLFYIYPLQPSTQHVNEFYICSNEHVCALFRDLLFCPWRQQHPVQCSTITADRSL